MPERSLAFPSHNLADIGSSLESCAPVKFDAKDSRMAPIRQGLPGFLPKCLSRALKCPPDPRETIPSTTCAWF
jgi:hypothetical protein